MSSLTAKTASFPALPEAPYNNLGSELNLAGVFLLISLTILEYLLSEASFSVCFISDKLYFLFCKLFKISSGFDPKSMSNSFISCNFPFLLI